MTTNPAELVKLADKSWVDRADELFARHKLMLHEHMAGRRGWDNDLHNQLMIALQEAWPVVRAAQQDVREVGPEIDFVDAGNAILAGIGSDTEAASQLAAIIRNLTDAGFAIVRASKTGE